jgi:hypothetical protein
MALVPARDHLGEFLLLLDSTNGRDKVARLVQYSAKALKWRAEVTKQPEDTVKVSKASAQTEHGKHCTSRGAPLLGMAAAFRSAHVVELANGAQMQKLTFAAHGRLRWFGCRCGMVTEPC